MPVRPPPSSSAGAPKLPGIRFANRVQQPGLDRVEGWKQATPARISVDLPPIRFHRPPGSTTITIPVRDTAVRLEVGIEGATDTRPLEATGGNREHILRALLRRGVTGEKNHQWFRLPAFAPVDGAYRAGFTGDIWFDVPLETFEKEILPAFDRGEIERLATTEALSRLLGGVTPSKPGEPSPDLAPPPPAAVNRMRWPGYIEDCKRELEHFCAFARLLAEDPLLAPGVASAVLHRSGIPEDLMPWVRREVGEAIFTREARTEPKAPTAEAFMDLASRVEAARQATYKLQHGALSYEQNQKKLLESLRRVAELADPTEVLHDCLQQLFSRPLETVAALGKESPAAAKARLASERGETYLDARTFTERLRAGRGPTVP